MESKLVLVVGATGYLGSKIVRAVIARGARVRAMVRPTSDRAALQKLGVTDFVAGDMMDPFSLQLALSHTPKADALIASAAGYTGHTKGDDPRIDTTGYRNLVDAAKATGIPRFVLISILESEHAYLVPHFHNKYLTELYLTEKRVPYIALRAGAFLDQARDFVLPSLRKGVYPAFFTGVALGMVYTPDLARYAAAAALDLPESALGSSVDIGWAQPASGKDIAQAFSKVLGKPIHEKPAFPPFVSGVIMPILGLFQPGVRDMNAMMRWVKTGAYVSGDPLKQRELFGDLPTVEEAVRRYCKDKGLAG